MNIIELARQAGIKNDCEGIWCNADQLQSFAELVVANIDPSKFIGGYQEGFEAGVAQTRARCIKLVLAGSAMPIQSRTLEALQQDRKRIAALIEEDGK